jgi:hypothetical protein
MATPKHIQTPPHLIAGPKHYAIILRGDELEPTYHDGDALIADPDEAPEAGDLVVIWHHGHDKPRLERLAMGLIDHPIRPVGADDGFSAVVAVEGQGKRAGMMQMVDAATVRAVDKVVGATRPNDPGTTCPRSGALQ